MTTRLNLPSILAAYFFCLLSCIAGMTPVEVKEFEAIKRDAEKGDAKAQFNLAGCYFTGKEWGRTWKHLWFGYVRPPIRAFRLLKIT